MLRKKHIMASSSQEKKPPDHPLSSLNIGTEDDAAGPSTLFASETSESSDSLQPASEKRDSSYSTNLPLLTAVYMSALTTGATTYAFSFYSSALKMSLHLTQSELDTLGSATFAAGVFSWIPGMIVDRYGSKLGIIVGGMGNACVLSSYWFVATGRLWELDSDNDEATQWLIALLSVLGVLTFMGCALITGSVFKLIVESCGKGSKGKAVGCAKGYVGVGSGVYVCIFRSLFRMTASTEGLGPAVLMSALPSGLSMTSTSIRHLSLTDAATSQLLQANAPPNPDIMNTLNFLLMAACLSFLAAVIPAIVFLPKHEIMQTKKPRDGTRSIHFRVIYAGLVLLGMWVVGTSLLDLKDEEGASQTTGGAKGFPPSIVNKTFHLDSDVDGDFVFDLMEEVQHAPDNISIETEAARESSIVQNDNEHLIQNNQQIGKSLSNSSSRDEQLLARAWRRMRRLSSSDSATEQHWGTAVLLIFLWWGPALSLLCIPPRKGSLSMDDYVSLDQQDETDEINIDESRNEALVETERDVFLNDTASKPKPMLLTKCGEAKDFTLIEMLRTVEAWLAAWTYVILVGGGTLMSCNIGKKSCFSRDILGIFMCTLLSNIFRVMQGK
jgi:MFS family permease